MRTVILYLLLFLLWNVLVSLVLLLAIMQGQELVGLLLALGLYFVLLWRVVASPRTPAERWALLRLRPLDAETRRWTLTAVPVLLALSWAVGEVYVRLVPVPPENFNPFGELMVAPGGRLAITILAVGIAPVVEEFFFRGFIQRTLERRFGTVAGIGAASAVFAAVHVLPWIFPLHFFLGVVFGYAVYAARSIWAGVILHAANNAVAVAGIGWAGDDPTPVPTLWEVGVDASWWLSLSVLLVSAFLAWGIARRLRSAGHRRSLRLHAAGG